MSVFYTTPHTSNKALPKLLDRLKVSFGHALVQMKVGLYICGGCVRNDQNDRNDQKIETTLTHDSFAKLLLAPLATLCTAKTCLGYLVVAVNSVAKNAKDANK